MINQSASRAIELLTAPLPDPSVLYLEKVNVPVFPKNCSSQTIVLHNITLKFQGDSSAVPDQALIFHKDCESRELKSGANDVFRVSVTPSLLFRQSTNYYSVTVTYSFASNLSVPKTEEFSFSGYLIVHPIPIVEESQAFISFKDSEDWELAQLAGTLLQRAGIKPYFARADHHLMNNNYWKDKIYPAIRSSKVTVALWTSQTLHDPKYVLLEMKQSKKEKVPVVLFLENGTEPPDKFPPKSKEYTLFERPSPHTVFAADIEALSKQLREGKRL